MPKKYYASGSDGWQSGGSGAEPYRRIEPALLRRLRVWLTLLQAQFERLAEHPPEDDKWPILDRSALALSCDQSQKTIDAHLLELERSGVVSVRRHGRAGSVVVITKENYKRMEAELAALELALIYGGHPLAPPELAAGEFALASLAGRAAARRLRSRQSARQYALRSALRRLRLRHLAELEAGNLAAAERCSALGARLWRSFWSLT